jgi:hypothetical protein
LFSESGGLRVLAKVGETPKNAEIDVQDDEI